MNLNAQLDQVAKHSTTPRADAAIVKEELQLVLAAVPELPVKELPQLSAFAITQTIKANHFSTTSAFLKPRRKRLMLTPTKKFLRSE